MSWIKIDLSTDVVTSDIDIKIRVNSSENELQVACANLMGLVASRQGFKVIKELTEDLERTFDERATDTKENH